MVDRVAEILEAHIKMAQHQLELVRSGVDFSFVEERPSVTVIPTTEDVPFKSAS